MRLYNQQGHYAAEQSIRSVFSRVIFAMTWLVLFSQMGKKVREVGRLLSGWPDLRGHKFIQTLTIHNLNNSRGFGVLGFWGFGEIGRAHV